MVCKKCGYDDLISNGDWLKCPNCGAEYFNTKIDFGASAADKAEENHISNEDNNFGFKIQIKSDNEKKASTAQKQAKPEIVFEEAEKETAQAHSKTEDAPPTAVTEETPKVKKAKQKKEKKARKKKSGDDEAEKKPQSKLKEAVDFLTPIVIAVIIALLLKTFVFANAIVPTGSMLNTIHEGDRIIASRLSYIKEDPQRYDIIIFNFPDNEERVFVKRIIGLPGETVTITNGIAYVKSAGGEVETTDQSFISETPIGDFGPFYIPFKGEIITYENGACYAENGMRVGSDTFLEMYCEKDENGNYYVAENCYFCMGDNRNYSEDSRFWKNTYVAENKILGKVKFRYYPSYEELK